jgi:hypothetical protein
MKNSSRPTKVPDDRNQLRAFRKAAREAGCDDNEERFQDALRTVAKAKPSVEKPKRPEQQQENKAKE